jgi:hypothetical protein
MGKVIGEQFKTYVSNQINRRQEAHGSGATSNRTMDQLTYLNSKTAWVKLASGVSVLSERLKDEDMRENFEWDSLAKHHILFGGTSTLNQQNEDSGILNPRGTYPNSDPSINIWGNSWGTYNVNASIQPGSEFGLVPMPGITSVDVKCMNRGSIRKATINLKCYSPEQFRIIDLLYLRLGYTVFLEYGNSLYLDKDGIIERQGYTLTEAKKFGFFSPRWKEKSYSAFLPVIEAYRANKMGNYDGMLAKVVNFSWTFAQDGSYDITLELISLGDVIESLKVNVTPSYPVSKFIKDAYNLYSEDTDADSKDLVSSPANNIITSYLFLQKLYLDININNEGGKTGLQRIDSREITIEAGGDVLQMGGSFINPPKDGIIKIDPIYWETENKEDEAAVKAFMDEFYSDHKRIDVSDTIQAEALLWSSSTSCYVIYYSAFLNDAYASVKTVPEVLGSDPNVSKIGDVIYLNYNEGKDDEEAPINDAGFYMRWGHLLQFINDNVISIIKGSDKKGKPTQIVGIDFNTWNNKMYTLPYQVSLDPRVCIVKSLDDINSKKYYQQLNPFKSANNEFAWPMNIYLSHNQIIASLNENMDEKGNVAFFDFLNSLCIAVNKAMGGINNLEPFLNEDENKIYIMDSSYQPKSDKPKYTLQLYGYNKNQKEAGFVRNFNLKTEITNDFATMASIGSTAGGYVKGTENTMFSKWNKGLIDRWKEEYESPIEESKLNRFGEIDEPLKMYVEEFWNKRYSPFGYTLMDVAYDWAWIGVGSTAAMNDDIIDSNVSVVTEFYKYIQAKIQAEQSGSYSSPSNGFIPINLGITMDGISGVKIYNEVNVNTSFLPNNYPKSLRFIIKGVNHKLSDSDWETTLETVVIAKTNDEPNQTLTQKQIKDIMDRYIQGGVASSGVGGVLTNVLDSVGFNIGGASGGAPGGAGGTGGGFNAGSGGGPGKISTCSNLPPQKGLSKSASKLIKSSSTAKDAVAAIINHLEGGYFHPSQAWSDSPKTIKKGYTIMKNSGETIYGIDRVAGGWMKSSKGKTFWNKIDQISGYGKYSLKNSDTITRKWDISKYPKNTNGWNYNYMPNISSILNEAKDMIGERFNNYLDSNFKNHPLKNIILKDGRLLFMWYRATWNGSGFFQKYATNIKKVYNNGETNIEKLICADLTFRYNTKASSFKPGVSKMAYMMDYNPS